MSLRLELSRGAALQATTLKTFVRGPGVTGFPRWRTPVSCPGLFDQQPTCARVIASSRDAAGHFCGRRGRACGRTLTLLCSLSYVMRLSLTRVNKRYLLALGTTQIKGPYFTKH